MYTEQDLVAIAKRENNKKRAYLVVDPLQGKHVPVSPKPALGVFRELAEKIKQNYRGERLLLVGFAETATAIGAACAVYNECYYMQTTREEVAGVTYFYFSEAHSHATEQRLAENDLDEVIKKIDRLVFVEDEVTTGNTILNIIRLIRKRYDFPVRFGVASLLNGMDDAARRVYEEQQIPLQYLVKTDHSGYTAVADGYRGDGTYIDCTDQAVDTVQTAGESKILPVFGYQNTRRLVNAKNYQNACESLWQQIAEKIKSEAEKSCRILVLGTEEFMYPALYVASKLEECAMRAPAKTEREEKEVRFHATTRSPIAVSSEEGYPLQTRYRLASFYDEARVTYIYDLAAYDKIYIITDAKEGRAGADALVRALRIAGNSTEDITIFRWTKQETDGGQS